MRTETIQIMAGAALLSAFTYMPILAKDYLSIDELWITVIVAAYASAGFVSSYIFGRAGDIFGRRIILWIGLLLATISFSLLIISDSFEILLTVRTLNGFSAGIYPGALAAYAYESEMKMGRFASFGAMGWGIGTFFAGYAASFSISYAFVVTSIFFLIAFLSALTLPDIQVERINVPWFPVETFKRNLPVYAAFFLRHSSASALWTLWPLFLATLGADTTLIGIIQASNSISQVIFMLVITDRFDCGKLFSAGLLSTSVAFGWFLLATNIWELLPSQVILGFAWSCLYVGALKYVTERNVERSTASGLLTSTQSLSGVIGPIIAYVYWSIWQSFIPIILNGIIMSLVAFLVFRYTSRGTTVEGRPLAGCATE